MSFSKWESQINAGGPIDITGRRRIGHRNAATIPTSPFFLLRLLRSLWKPRRPDALLRVASSLLFQLLPSRRRSGLRGKDGPLGRLLLVEAGGFVDAQVIAVVGVGEDMGNCLNSSLRVESAHSPRDASYSSKVVSSKRSLFSVSSSRTAYSIPSTLSVQSFTDKPGSMILPTPRTEGEILSSSQLKNFTFNELRNTTRNFRSDGLLGEGGFGYVYKGWIDEQTFSASKPGCGMVVAVKKLKPESFQGHKEWLTEVDYLGQLHHPNLVKLIGYCSEGDNKLLVYEFMPKGSLENHLFRRGAQPLSWATRIKVAIGAARGLTFLHDAESQVIYRDFKASNILLDSEFNPKLSDFGLAKAGPTGDKTHVSTQVIGTHGYAAPEYIATGRLSVKADVYSFGVVLLELLWGRRAIDKSKMGIEQKLVEWARPCLGDKRKLYRIMDTRLEGQYTKKGAHAVSLLALHCISLDAKRRPRMSDVLASLEQLQDPKSTVFPLPKDRRKTAGASPSRQ